ncbi:hypothetical protein LSH36_253g04029 [Paralvinella palmiformis]|uniref:protein-tyrosine-phosphatase n=1 Tax=Paralvinella palmiformis TaxID=53620 RepID=A0AAD9JL21_9ANNE|nr:hypothetical protein LSH36_253g04029 [Paralvinella palmiformis]
MIANKKPTLTTTGDKKIKKWISVTVNFTNPFTDKNGDVVSYSIIVVNAERQIEKLTDDITDNWYNAHTQTPCPPYAAIYKCETLFQQGSTCSGYSHSRRKRSIRSYVVITIGEESCDENEGYCNGPLKPNTQYIVFIRAYNEENEFTDANSVIVKTDKKPILAEVLSSIIVLILVVIVLVVIFLWRRGILFKKDSTTKTKRLSLPAIKKLYVVSHAVNIEDFAEYCKDMSANSNMKFAAEYENLKLVGRDQSIDVSQITCNRTKNRFTNILPYDHSRVKLLPTDGEEGYTDYINASWLPGYNSKKEFIACQGPLPGTVDDHWRMIWEYNCQAIIMLANCVEGNRDKCYHYWPHDREPMFYGDLQVQIVRKTRDKEHEEPEFITTQMTISQGEQVKRISHYHYLIWPDHGVPNDLESLIRFVKEVRSHLTQDGGPIVVHCSAGVGRTGTFITLDRLLQTIEEHQVVDIYGIVHEMRMSRPFMVQTEIQYIFIHKCLLFELQSSGLINDGYEEEDDVDEDLYENV